MEAITGAPRGELLEWINSTLKLNLHKIEETASGWLYFVLLMYRCCSMPNYWYDVSWFISFQLLITRYTSSSTC